VRRLVYCNASFSVFSLRRAKLPIIYLDIRLDYKLATLPLNVRKSLGLDFPDRIHGEHAFFGEPGVLGKEVHQKGR
jgi:hypothetical protein